MRGYDISETLLFQDIYNLRQQVFPFMVNCDQKDESEKGKVTSVASQQLHQGEGDRL